MVNNKEYSNTVDTKSLWLNSVCTDFKKTIQTWSFWEQRWIAKDFHTKLNPLSKDEAFTKRQQEGYILNISIYFMVEDTETWWTVWPCLTLWIKYISQKVIVDVCEFWKNV